MSDSFDITTIIFALLALFVLFKLKSVLGTRTGNERPPVDPSHRQKNNLSGSKSDEIGNVVQLPGAGSQAVQTQSGQTGKWNGYAEEKAWSGLDAITSVEGAFYANSFLDGSKAAYEMIVTAFAKGDRSALKDLLANEVYDGFAAAISTRETRGDKIETTLVAIEKAIIEDAQLRGNVAQITVRFVTKLITATRDRDNNIVDGNPEKVIDVTDLWTFSREQHSENPNWKLIATETG